MDKKEEVQRNNEKRTITLLQLRARTFFFSSVLPSFLCILPTISVIGNVNSDSVKVNEFSVQGRLISPCMYLRRHSGTCDRLIGLTV